MPRSRHQTRALVAALCGVVVHMYLDGYIFPEDQVYMDRDGNPIARSLFLGGVERPLIPAARRDLGELWATDPAAFRADYRFTFPEMQTIAVALPLPEVIHTRSRFRVAKQDALAIYLHYMASPTRLVCLVRYYAASMSRMSEIIREFGTLLFQATRRYMTFDGDYLQQRVPMYAAALRAHGCPYVRCWGFLDVTVQVCRKPVVHERQMYNAKGHAHGLKFQTVTVPDGMVDSVFGPRAGIVHDFSVLRESTIDRLQLPLLNDVLDLNHVAEDEVEAASGRPYILYADKAYIGLDYVAAPRRRNAVGMTAAEQNLGKIMSKKRVTVEWSYRMTRQQFAYLNFSHNIKVLLSPVGIHAYNCFFLINCFTAARRGNQIYDYFEVEDEYDSESEEPEQLRPYLEPPTLQNYIRRVTRAEGAPLP